MLRHTLALLIGRLPARDRVLPGVNGLRLVRIVPQHDAGRVPVGKDPVEQRRIGPCDGRIAAVAAVQQQRGVLSAQSADSPGIGLPFGMPVFLHELFVLQIAQLHLKAEAVAERIVGHAGVQIGAGVAQRGNGFRERVAEHLGRVEHRGMPVGEEVRALGLCAAPAADAVNAVDILRIDVRDRFRHEGIPAVPVHALPDGGQQLQPPLRIGQRGLAVSMRFVKAGRRVDAADLVVQNAVRAEGAHPLRALGHQRMPVPAPRTDGDEDLAGIEPEEVAFGILAVLLIVRRAPARFALHGLTAAAVEPGPHVNQMPLNVQRHVAATVLHRPDAFPEQLFAAHGRADLQIGIPVVVAALKPAEQAERIAAVLLRQIIQRRNLLIGPERIAELLAVDDQEIAVHVLHPAPGRHGPAPCGCPVAVLIGALLPCALIQPQHVLRTGPRFSRLHIGHLAYFQRHIALFSAHGAQGARVEPAVVSGQIQALIPVDQGHPLHAQRVGIGRRQLALAVPRLPGGQLVDDVGVVLAVVVRIQQPRPALSQRFDGADAGIVEIVHNRFGAVFDLRTEAHLFAM